MSIRGIVVAFWGRCLLSGYLDRSKGVVKTYLPRKWGAASNTANRVRRIGSQKGHEKHKVTSNTVRKGQSTHMASNLLWLGPFFRPWTLIVKECHEGGVRLHDNAQQCNTLPTLV